jgi:hypothetical protein
MEQCKQHGNVGASQQQAVEERERERERERETECNNPHCCNYDRSS